MTHLPKDVLERRLLVLVLGHHLQTLEHPPALPAADVRPLPLLGEHTGKCGRPGGGLFLLREDRVKVLT